MMGNLTELTVTRNRLSEQVVQHFEFMILGGELAPGDRLPSEREIADQLRVSRTVVREAIKTLEQHGLLKVLTGSGTYVTRADPETVSRPLAVLIKQGSPSFDHLTEVRRILELEIAAFAAERARAEDVVAMEDALRQMEGAVNSLDSDTDSRARFAEADLAFHSALVEAAQNPLLAVLLAPITEHLLEFRRQASSVPGAMEDALHYHRALLNKVKDRNPSASRELMQEHLIKAELWGRQAVS